MQLDPFVIFIVIEATAILAMLIIRGIADKKSSRNIKEDLLGYAWNKDCLNDSLARAMLGISSEEAERRLQLLELQGEEECIIHYKNRMTNEFDIKQARAKQLNTHSIQDCGPLHPQVNPQESCHTRYQSL